MNENKCDFELLSKNECNIILENSLKTKDVRLINYKIENASTDAVGFLGEYYKLIIQTENKNYHYFFVKSLPVTLQEERKMLEDCGIFEKEIKLYRTILKKLLSCSNYKWQPECYYTNNSLIVLEDLGKAGYCLSPDKNEFSEEHLKACLHSLAAMHASSIIYEKIHETTITQEFGSILFETSIAKDNIWFLAGIKSLKAVALHHPKFQSIEYQNFILNKFLEKINLVCEMVKTSEKYKNVLCHRDPWGKNMFFKYETTSEKNLSCILIDFQICRYSPPAIDVLFCIYLNVSRQLREKIFIDSLYWYYKYLTLELELSGLDVNNYITEKEFLESCKTFKLWPVMYNALASTIINLPNGVLNDLRKNNPKKYQYFTLENRNELVLEYIEKDRNYRECIFEAIEELMEVLYTD